MTTTSATSSPISTYARCTHVSGTKPRKHDLGFQSPTLQSLQLRAGPLQLEASGGTSARTSRPFVLDVAIWTGSKIIGITADAKVWAWVLANAESFGLSWESQDEASRLRLTVGDRTAQRVLDVENWFAQAA